MASVALVPARAGSKRLANKNRLKLDGRELIWWTVDAARDSDCYDRIVVCSDDVELVDQAATRTGLWGHLRDPVPDTQCDLEWVADVMRLNQDADTFSLLRPTSPFRGPDTIRRAWEQWEKVRDDADSLRAVRRVSEHPGKMWTEDDRGWWPFLEDMPSVWPERPWNEPTQSLPQVFIQTAGLEIAHSRVLEQGSISGDRVAPFIVDGPEALDVNTQWDWDIAEAIVSRGEAWWQ